jgi:hypothetical protein
MEAMIISDPKAVKGGEDMLERAAQPRLEGGLNMIIKKRIGGLPV